MPRRAALPARRAFLSHLYVQTSISSSLQHLGAENWSALCSRGAKSKSGARAQELVANNHQQPRIRFGEGEYAGDGDAAGAEELRAGTREQTRRKAHAPRALRPQRARRAAPHAARRAARSCAREGGRATRRALALEHLKPGPSALIQLAGTGSPFITPSSVTFWDRLLREGRSRGARDARAPSF